MLNSFLLLVILVSNLACGEPYEAYPIKEQYPPVARLGQAFDWQPSSDTYKSSQGGSLIVYEALDLPNWLSWDSKEGRFSGRFSEDFLEGLNEKKFRFVLQGTDLFDNKTLSRSYELVAARAAGPRVREDFDLLDLLKKNGVTNGKNGLKLTPGEKFSVKFSKNDVVSDPSSPIVAFYARSTRFHTSLPPWVQFYGDTLEFNGVAPAITSEAAPELYYSFSLIATDIEGYSGTEIPFQLNIGGHQLVIRLNRTLEIATKSGTSFDYDLPFEYIYLDSQPINVSEIKSLALDSAPDWIKLKDNKLVGDAPKDVDSTAKFSVAIFDFYSNVVYMNFSVRANQELFAVSMLPDVNATRNSWFQISLSPFQFTNINGTKIDVEYKGADWLHFAPSNLTFNGFVPEEFDFTSVDVSATRGDNREVLSFRVNGVNDVSKLISATQSTSNISTNSSQDSLPSRKSSMDSIRRTIELACSITIPIVLLLFLISYFVLRRSNIKNKLSEQDTELSKNKISGPKLGNPANYPNPFIGDSPVPETHSNSMKNPFADPNLSPNARKLAALNAINFDNYSSDNSLDYEKRDHTLDSAAVYCDPVRPVTNGEIPDSKVNTHRTDRDTSIYFNNNSTKRKSWRNSHSSKSGALRESYASVQTVTTNDLLHTDIEADKDIEQNPNKSTFGPRNSVFGSVNRYLDGQNINKRSVLTPLEETNDRLNDNDTEDSSNRLSGSSGGSDFIPLRQGNTYQFTPKNSQVNGFQSDSNSGTRKIKRLLNLANKGGVNVKNIDVIGQEPERD